MSVYTDLLRMALLKEGDRNYVSLSELVDRVASRKAVLHLGSRHDSDSEVDHEVASVLGRELDYDVALVRLCEHLGIEQELTNPSSGPSERRYAEEQVCERVPSLVPVLLGASTDVESPRAPNELGHREREGARGGE